MAAARSIPPPAAGSRARSPRPAVLLSAACTMLVALVAAVTVSPAAGVRAATAVSSTAPDGPTIPVYGQQWQPWGPQDLGTSSSTIASEGCALTASTMLLEDYGISTNPGILNQWLINHGGYVDQNLLVWGAVAQYAGAQGVSVSYAGGQADSVAAIDSSLSAGNPVIAQVSLDGNMHFILITGMGPDGTLWINDPWFGDHTTFQSRYGNPATQIQWLQFYTGTAVTPPSLSTMTAGGSETVLAPSGGLGTLVSGNQVLDLPYTTSTANWLQGTPTTVASWSNQQIDFTAPTPLSDGFVVVETAYGDPNFWFPYTVASEAAVTVASLSPTVGAGPGGTTVTVTGTGFYLPAQVTFGGEPASSIVEISPTELQVVTPQGAGTEQVEVADWLGASSTSSGDTFTYQAALPPGALVPLTPARICDTRPDNPSGLSGAEAQCDGKALSAGSPLTVQVAGLAGVPQGAVAVSLNVTAVDPSGSGYLTVYPAGQTPPLTSSLNFQSGQTVADLVEVGLGSQGQVEVVTSAPSADVVIDVEGYFAASTSGGGLYNPLPPTRICDTRAGQPQNQCTGKTLGPGGTLTVQVSGLAGVPSSAEAVSLDVAATDTTAASYLTVYPSGSVPTSSNLNWTAGATVANQVVATLNSNGAINIYNLSGSTDVVVDLFGFFTGSGGTGAQLSAAYTPARICDTRLGQPSNQCTGKTLGPGTSLEVQVAGLAGVPADAKAVVVTVTVTNTTAASYLTVFPSGTVPLISNLNWTAGATVPNLVTATLNPTGGITVYNHSGSADLLIDVMGWYS